MMSQDRFVNRQKRKCNEQNSESAIQAKRKKLKSGCVLTVGQAPSSFFEPFQTADDAVSLCADDTSDSSVATFSPPLAPGSRQLDWKKFEAENLDLDYVRLFTKREADNILKDLEKAIVYNTGQLARVRMFGKWVDIPRKQTAYGEEGLTYTFSGNTVPARPWVPQLTCIRDLINRLTGTHFNFVLVNRLETMDEEEDIHGETKDEEGESDDECRNIHSSSERYKDGSDHMGEHKDDEKDLAPDHPIASLSLGQPRDFYFRHQDSRGKNASRSIDKVSLLLDHGSLLLMNHPTNRFWYHTLPKRKACNSVRINLTFRSMNIAKCKPVKKEA